MQLIAERSLPHGLLASDQPLEGALAARASPGTSRAPKFAVEKVSRSFGGTAKTQALDAIDFTVADGETVCLVGPSGCGKSTLLEIMAGLQRPDEGRVLCDGVPVAAPGRDRMVMFQEPALFPWLNVLQNVMFGLKLKPGLTDAQRRDIALQHLALVGLEKKSRANVHELSGGMKQRVALARSLAPDPDVLLMDEPFAALDAMTREQLYWDIQRVQRETRKTIVLVTHNIREAVCLGDRVILMSAGPGRVREEFAVPLARPRDVNSPDLASLAGHITAILKGFADRPAAE